MFLPPLINNKEYTIMKEIMKKKGIISDFQKRKLTPFGGKFFCKISIQLLSRMWGGGFIFWISLFLLPDIAKLLLLDLS